MKKILLSLILILAVGWNFQAISSEVEEDYLDIAANYCVVGDYNAAIGYLDKILELNPNNTQVKDLKKGLNHIVSGDKKTYVSGLNPLIKEAQEAKRIGDDRAEIIALYNATKSNNSYLAYYFLGNYYRDRNDYLKALDAYNSSVSANPEFAQAYLASALTLFEVQKYDSVINPIDKYLIYNPNDDLAYAVKGRAEFELGNLESAKVNNDKAIELNNCPEYQFDKAKILYKSGDYKAAKEMFTELLPDIQTSKTYEYLGLCDIELKNYMSALMNIDKALILSDDDEYLENKYNEIKKILEESNQNGE